MNAYIKDHLLIVKSMLKFNRIIEAYEEIGKIQNYLEDSEKKEIKNEKKGK